MKVLTFLNLLDSEGNLSISNIAVIVCVTKLALATQFSVAEVGALMISLFNYMHKRHVSSNVEDQNSPNG